MEAPPVVSNLAVMALEVAGVSVRFGGLTALDDVSLAVAPGEVVGVIGPNGAGKTTLFNVICGYVRPDAGQVRLDGAPLPARPHDLTRHGIARTLQGVGLFARPDGGRERDGRRPERGPARSPRCSGCPTPTGASARLRALALAQLDALGVADAADRYPGACRTASRSGSRSPARWSPRPQLLLLDEPAGGLGDDDMDELGELIRGAGRPRCCWSSTTWRS